MAALTKDRATPERDGRRVIDQIGPTTVIHAGAMYIINEDGDATPADPSGRGRRRASSRRAPWRCAGHLGLMETPT
ncbi:hypothetical protein MASR1M50_08980 [Burkholderiales bacterium]